MQDIFPQQQPQEFFSFVATSKTVVAFNQQYQNLTLL
jgi:hypothetical protein